MILFESMLLSYLKQLYYSLLILLFGWLSRVEQLFRKKESNLGDHGFFASLRDMTILWSQGIMGVMKRIYDKYPGYSPVDFYVGPNRCVLLRDAAHIRKVYASQSYDFEGFKMTQDRFRRLLGFNLITVSQPGWKDLRHRTMQFLTGKALNRYQMAMEEVMKNKMLPIWKEHEEKGIPLDVWDNMLLYSSKVVFMSFMGLKDEEVPQDVHFLLNELFCLFRTLLLAVFNVPRWIPTPTNRAFNEKMGIVRKFIEPHLEKQKTMNTMLGSIIRSHTKRQFIPFVSFRDFLQKLLKDKTEDPNFDFNGLESYYESKIMPPERDLCRSVKDLLSMIKLKSEDSIDNRDQLQTAIESFLCQYSTFDREVVFQEIISNLIGGSETTIVLMMFSCYFLSQYPNVQKQLREELRKCKQDGITIEEQINKGYLGMFLNEVLRLGPPAFMSNRVLTEDINLEDSVNSRVTHIPKGTIIWMSQYFVHRDPKFWEDPLTFNPDRWRKSEIIGSFFPFASGPRQCPGNLYAKREAAISVSTMIENFSIEHYDPNYKLTLDANITLRAKDHITLRLKKID